MHFSRRGTRYKKPKSFHQCTKKSTCRLRDGNLMSKYFHKSCRLAYAGSDGQIVICDSSAFYDKVTNRYENESPHKPYKYLKQDTRLGDANTIISIEFASPQLAMVTFKVGQPPFLWTDLLTCVRITENGETKWWIAHKSSDSEELPLS